MNKQATLKDLAAATGLSVMACSYALRKSPQVSQETQQRVADKAKEIGYSPNKTAQALRQLREQKRSGQK